MWVIFQLDHYAVSNKYQQFSFHLFFIASKRRVSKRINYFPKFKESSKIAMFFELNFLKVFIL